MDTKFFWTQNTFGRKIFLRPNISLDQKNFLDLDFLDLDFFFEPDVFEPQIILDTNIFWAHKIFGITTFWGQIFFQTWIFFRQFFFYHKIFNRHTTVLDPKLLWTQNFFLIQNFYRTQYFFELGDFHERRGIKPFQTEHIGLKFCEIHKPKSKPKIIRTLIFVDTNFFWPNISLDQKVVGPKFFPDPNFFGLRFSGLNSFLTLIFLDTKNFGTQY